MRTKKRIGNEATNRARVPVRFCSHFSFSRACTLRDARLSNFQGHPMSQPHEWPSIAAQGTKTQKMPILAEPGRPGTVNLRAKPFRAKVYRKNRVICVPKSHCPFRLKERKRNFYLGGAPSKGFATLHEEWRQSCFFRDKILGTQSVTFRLVWAISRRNYFEMRSGKCGSWKRTGLWNIRRNGYSEVFSTFYSNTGILFNLEEACIFT